MEAHEDTTAAASSSYSARPGPLARQLQTVHNLNQQLFQQLERRFGHGSSYREALSAEALSALHDQLVSGRAISKPNTYYVILCQVK